MPKITDEQFATAQAANPDVELEILDGRPITEDEIIVRPASEAAWEIFRKKLVANDLGAGRMLVEACRIFPSKEEVAKIFAKRPGLAGTWSIDCQRITGVLEGEHHRKP